MLRPIASRLAVTNTGAIIKRNSGVVAGPPTRHISRGEKYFLASIMMVGFTFTPAYILTNLKHYRG